MGVKEWAIKMGDILSTIKAVFAASSFTTFWGWFTDVTLTGLVGILGVLFTAWLGWQKHKREQEAHRHKMRNGY